MERAICHHATRGGPSIECPAQVKLLMTRNLWLCLSDVTTPCLIGTSIGWMVNVHKQHQNSATSCRILLKVVQQRMSTDTCNSAYRLTKAAALTGIKLRAGGDSAGMLHSAGGKPKYEIIE